MDLASAQELPSRDKHEFQKWLVFFNGWDSKTDKPTLEKAIISVKGGLTKGVGMVADLVETIGREKAALGILLMAALPTKEMESRAAAAGFFETGLEAKVPRIQILTLAELFQGKRPTIPNINPAMFKAAPKEKPQQPTLL